MGWQVFWAGLAVWVAVSLHRAVGAVRDVVGEMHKRVREPGDFSGDDED